MSQSIRRQLTALRKEVHIPYRIKYVNRVIHQHEFEEKTIYLHVWINDEPQKELTNELAIKSAKKNRKKDK